MTLRITSRWTALSAIAFATVSSFVALSGPAGADGAPTAVAEQTSVAEGTFVRVSGTGWTAARTGLVFVQVCGNAGINQSADCDLAGAASGGVRDGGIFYTGITVHVPPKPCPCVLRVYTVEGVDPVLIPIEIDGVPTQAPSSAVGVLRRVSVSGVHVESADAWPTWFGAAPHRRLAFSVTNTGDTLLRSPAVTLAFGRGSSPDGFVASPNLGDIAPGQTVVNRVDLPMDVLSVGTYRVTVKVDPIGAEAATGSAQTTVIPWGLIALALLLAQLVLLRIRNRYRRRLARLLERADALDESELELVGAGAPVAFRRVPGLRASATLAMLGACLLGCSGSSSGGATPNTVTPDPDCPLTLEAASDLLPQAAVSVEPPPIGSEIDQPSTRCQYQSGTSTLQLSVFPNSKTLDRLKGLLPNASAAPEVSVGAYCDAHQGATEASISCIFLARDRTNVLALSVPNARFDSALVTRLRGLATVLANKVS
ncbi:MAG: hypothetical protein QOI95_3595 [Acidimicrobiaceae bacterium]